MKEQIINQHKISKSSITARNPYEYSLVERARGAFVPCKIMEEGEDLTFSYDITGLTAYENLKALGYDAKLLALIDVASLANAAGNLKFSLSPDNLHYDIHHNTSHHIYTMDWDIG